MKNCEINFGLNRFVKSIYFLTCCLINISIGFSILVTKLITVKYIEKFQKTIIFFGLIISIFGIIGLYNTEYDFYPDYIGFHSKKGKELYNILSTEDCKLRKKLYLVLTLGISIILVPIFTIFPNTVLPTYISSLCMFTGVLYNPLIEKINLYIPIINGGLFGLFVVTIYSLFSYIFYDYDVLNNLVYLYSSIPIISILIKFNIYYAYSSYNDALIYFQNKKK